MIVPRPSALAVVLVSLVLGGCATSGQSLDQAASASAASEAPPTGSHLSRRAGTTSSSLISTVNSLNNVPIPAPAQ